jgi:hypothetical protein
MAERQNPRAEEKTATVVRSRKAELRKRVQASAYSRARKPCLVAHLRDGKLAFLRRENLDDCQTTG